MTIIVDRNSSEEIQRELIYLKSIEHDINTSIAIMSNESDGVDLAIITKPLIVVSAWILELEKFLSEIEEHER